VAKASAVSPEGVVMLTIRESNRREFLRVGALSLAGLSLSQLAAVRGAASSARDAAKDRSVILLFLQGGPSQIETFDPKMSAPAGVRSANGEVQTSLPGVTFGGAFPKLAAMADQVSIVRSFRTGDGNHDIKPVVGRATGGANLGSLYSRVVGANHPSTGMTSNAVLFPRAVDPETQAAEESFGKLDATGNLGRGYAPFVPGAGGSLQQDMQLMLPRTRLDERRALLGQLDRYKRLLDGPSAAGLDRYHEQAYSIILGGVANAFDLSREDPQLVARYDTAPLVTPDAISRKWNNYNNYVDNAKSLGKLLLLARRLCESGCGFVTVTTNFVWDMHADINNAGVAEGMEYMGRPLDHALSVFLEDVAARGLSEKILLVVVGEMGRSPRINNEGGRDHWGNLAPLLFAGGGLKMGQVVGQSTRDAGEPLSRPYEIPHLVSTVLDRLFDVPQLRLVPGLPNEVIQAASGEVISELV
jgi:hypothetical protein